MVKWLTILVGTLAVIWSGWWFIGSTALEKGATVMVADARAAGWQVQYDDLSVAGFPSRFDTTVTAPDIVTPDGAFRFTAPFLQVFALSYRPNHVIAVAPHEMTLEIPGDVIDVTSADLRGSVVFSASADPVLVRSTVATDDLRIALADLAVGLRAGQFATRQAGGEADHDIALSLTALDLAPSLRALLDPANALPDQIDGVEIEAEVSLTDGIGPERMPLITDLLLRRAELIWGDLRANLTGPLTFGADGLPEGTLTLRLTDWEPLILNMVALGMTTPGQARLIDAGIGGLVNAQGQAEIPVVFAAGQVRVLGLPIADLRGL